MTKRTTESWEALLDGATPGPWRWYWDHGTMTLEGADTMPVATDLHVHDSDLLAAAPEAVAEVVRLRRALTHWAEGLDTLADEMREEGYIMNSEQVKAVTAGIRRILNGDTDE